MKLLSCHPERSEGSRFLPEPLRFFAELILSEAEGLRMTKTGHEQFYYVFSTCYTFHSFLFTAHLGWG